MLELSALSPWLYKLSRIVTTGSFVFYLLIAPAMFVAGKMGDYRIIGVLALGLYVGGWILVCNWLTAVASKFYGFKMPFLYQNLSLYIPDQNLTRLNVLEIGLAAYLLTIYLFALAYTYLSRRQPESFNYAKLDLFSAAYFSVTIMSTVGFGDIHPTNALARLLVMCEMLLGIAFAVLIFSLLASFASSR